MIRITFYVVVSAFLINYHFSSKSVGLVFKGLLMLNNNVTELVFETILPLCEDDMIIGKESLGSVNYWFLVPNNFREFLVDLWQLGSVECLILIDDSLFAGFSERNLNRFDFKGQEDAGRIKKRLGLSKCA